LPTGLVNRRLKEIKKLKYIFHIKNKFYKGLAIGYCLITIASFSNCKIHYGFSGATIPPEAKTVAVQYFQTTASLAPPTLSQAFTEALKDKMSSQTRLALVNKSGDLNFEGSISGYSTSPIAIQSSDLAALNRLTISVNVKYSCSFDEKKNFEQTFSRFADYNSSQSLNSVEDQLIKDINEQITQDIFNRALNDW
jgi:hypothetical protein